MSRNVQVKFGVGGLTTKPLRKWSTRPKGLVETLGRRRRPKKFSAPRYPFSRYSGSNFDILTSFPDKPEMETVTAANRWWGVSRATIPENFAKFRRRVPELFAKNL